MAESKRRARKDLSDSDESPSVNQKKIKGTSTAPLCKYGAQCYRKHPDHLRAFRHPSPSPEPSEDDDDDDNPASKATTTACSLSPSKATASSSSATTTTMTLLELSELHGEKLLSHLYEMEFPRDLYEFWQFCSMINKKKPRDALKILLNLELVNPFEVLDGRLNACKTLPNIHLQYRYVYDTPEFMTLIRSTEQSSQFHIGYYRDAPDELPVYVVSNDANVNNRFKFCGENLFAAVDLYARQILKSNHDRTDLKEFLDELETYAKKQKFPLEEMTPKMTARKKKSNCTLLNSLGMLVPMKNDIGYRPVPLSKDEFKKICDKFCNGTTDHIRQSAEDDLQHVITCIQFANDECDYGEGLEFGLNLFLYGSSKLHSRIMSLLPLAYKLLERHLYARILTDHLASGRSIDIDELDQISKHI